ncbi:MAG: carbohydrate ABC transporter permease [Ardenticatenaceae bacterium]|nr:carbohydrate ABC transporter permease [Anaerolineales bacterium]MCB8940877.1 carbohydrate ABC transporter permease [Ardenticatenaceae bacterium]MCB8972216.1 carbohydrate ABC transporter permease [Ardenticatenaceae bacterium]
MSEQILETAVSPEVLAVQQKHLRRQKLNRASTYVIAILISLWILIPIFFIFSMAFTTQEAVRAYPKSVLPFIPFSLDTMRFFLNSEGIVPGLMNSVIVAVITLLLSTIIAAPAGYAISRYIFPGRNFFRLSILAVRAFPIVVLSIPLAVLFIQTGIFDSIYSLALMHTALALPTTILVVGSVFASIPYELEEAAMVFGCTPWQAFRHVVLPLVLPGIAASAVFTFVLSWNEVFAASILTLQNRTLPAQILFSLSNSSEAYQFAGGFFMLIPALIFMFFIRRYLFNMWGQVTK